MRLPWSRRRRVDPAEVARIELAMGILDERSGLPASLALEHALDPERAAHIASRVAARTAESGHRDAPGAVRRTWYALSSSAAPAVAAAHGGAVVDAAARGIPPTAALAVGLTAATGTAVRGLWHRRRAAPPAPVRATTLDSLRRTVGRPGPDALQEHLDRLATRAPRPSATAPRLRPRLDHQEGTRHGRSDR